MPVRLEVHIFVFPACVGRIYERIFIGVFHFFFPYLSKYFTITSVSVLPSASAFFAAASFTSVGIRNELIGVLGLFGTRDRLSVTVCTRPSDAHDDCGDTENNADR